MARIRVTSNTTALKAAAEVIAAAVRVYASRFSTRIPAATRAYLGPGSRNAFVSAGRAGGEWGWTPIHAWMFEAEHDGRVPKHPFFGNRKRWYYQPYRPYLEEGAEASAQQAANVYADLSIAKWLAQSGYK